MKRVTLSSAFPYFITGAIFKAMDDIGVPWMGEIDPVFLDAEYFTNRSGEKYSSRLLMQMYNDDTQMVDKGALPSIAQFILNRYKLKWEKIYETLSFQYNPIHNYDAEEDGNNDLNHGHIINTSGDAQNNVWANNTGDALTDGDPESKQTTNAEQKNTGIDKTTYHWHRKGNIGVMSTQDLIKQERDLWQWQLIDVVFADCDNLLTIPIFDIDEKEEII